MSVGQRIKEIIFLEKISNKTFAELIGVHANSVSKMIKSDKPPKIDTIIDINRVFPTYSLDWLINGDGNKLSMVNIPVTTDVEAGELSACVGLVKGEDHITVPIMQKDYKALRVSGDSMEPTLYEGDVVLCDIVENRIDISPKKLYVIDSDQGLVVKRVHINERVNRIRLTSDNKIYSEKNLELSDVKSIWEVKSIIKK